MNIVKTLAILLIAASATYAANWAPQESALVTPIVQDDDDRLIDLFDPDMIAGQPPETAPDFNDIDEGFSSPPVLDDVISDDLIPDRRLLQRRPLLRPIFDRQPLRRLADRLAAGSAKVKQGPIRDLLAKKPLRSAFQKAKCRIQNIRAEGPIRNLITKIKENRTYRQASRSDRRQSRFPRLKNFFGR